VRADSAFNRSMGVNYLALIEEGGSDMPAPGLSFVVMTIALVGIVIAVRKIPRTEQGQFQGCGCSAGLIGVVAILVFFIWAASLINLIFALTGS
jgi:hypothetical protein